MKNPTMTCRNCSGLGELPLPDGLAQAYKFIDRFGPSTVAQVAKGTRVELTATHHRMKRLLALKMVIRVSEDNPGVYKVAP